MEPFVICKVNGEKNSRIYSKCRNCESPLPQEWESSSWEHVFQNNLERCHSCNARIKKKSKYCHRCGKKQEHEETVSLSRPKQEIDIEFSRDHRSLERAIQSFDTFFAEQAKQPDASEDKVFNQKKIWYFNQKERFLQRNISNKMFYNNLKSLQAYSKSMAIIPELLEPETHNFPEVPTQSSSSIIDHSKEISPETAPQTKPESEELHSLFFSIQYQVQDLIF